jgi:hypothetical protein
MGTEKPYIILWRELAEQALGWEGSEQWSNYDFEKLSEIIFEKTNTRLSVSTLKRIWEKVKYDNSPTIITLNALAHFLDLADWRAFKKQADDNKIIVSKLSVTKRKAFKFAIRPIYAALTLMIIITIGAILIKRNENDSIKVSFKSRVISDKMPNSVVFDYSVSGHGINKVMIQQSWDTLRRELVTTTSHQHTCIYYYPGYFNAKLVVNGMIKAQHPVFIQTNGWMGILVKKPVPAYLDSNTIRLPHALGITDVAFAKVSQSPVFNNLWVYFYNVRDFKGLEGNDFDFKVTLKNTSSPAESSCRNVTVEILGTNDAIKIPLADMGCIANLNLSIGNKQVYGKENDLSAFGCDFSNYQQLEFKVNNKQFIVSLNNKQIFATIINEDIGKIKGVCIGFEGSGEIKSIGLGNKDGVGYKEDFSAHN